MMKNISVEKLKCSQYTKEIMLLCKKAGFASYNETRNIMTYNWNYGDFQYGEDIGYILKNGETIVGFAGCIYSNRSIENKKVVQCNFTTMVILPEFRGYSMLLFLACCGEGDVILDYTPSPQVREILLSKYFGFHPLEKCRFCFNLIKFKRFTGIEATTDVFEMLGKVDETTEADILNNAKFGIVKFLSVNIEGSMLVIGYRTSYKNHVLKTAEILYINNRQLFKDCFEEAGYCLRKIGGVYFMHIDSRFLPDEYSSENFVSCYESRFGKTVQLFKKATVTEHYGAVYKTNNGNEDIDPAMFDALYTERVLM